MYQYILQETDIDSEDRILKTAHQRKMTGVATINRSKFCAGIVDRPKECSASWQGHHSVDLESSLFPVVNQLVPANNVS